MNDKIENIHLAATLTDKCFTYILSKLKLGVDEGAIMQEIESFFRKNGAKNAFPPIVAFGKHASQPHFNTPDNEPLTNNQLVLLDFGAKVNGYCADMTRTVFIGKPNDEWVKAYNIVSETQQAVINEIEKYFDVSIHQSINISGATMDRIAKDRIEKAGYPPYKHSLGHAIGHKVHEAPRLSVKRDALIYPGMVFTIEPGIYIENEYGIRIEDTVLLKEDGLEILTKSSKDLLIL